MDQQSRAFEQLEATILGCEPRYTRLQVARLAGVPIERAEQLWRALGFAGVGDDEVVFTDDDVEALRLITSLVAAGVVPQHAEASLARSLGQSMARLTEWQTEVVRDALGDDTSPGPEVATLAESLVPAMERLQSFIWRRHLAATAGRVLAVPADSTDLAVGFVDVVGFTRLSRSLDDADLARFIEHFEATATQVVADAEGRVVKMIGDEVMFVADTPAAAARIATELAHRPDVDDEFPAVRAGVAYGAVLSRLGDVYGPVVNVAARLTSLARPGTVLVDRGMRDALEAEPGFEVRKLRRVSVRGYARLEPAVLRTVPLPESDA